MVRGQDPKTKELSLKGEVLEIIHDDRSVNMDLANGRTCLFERKEVKKDTTKAYREAEKEEFPSQVAGTVLEAKVDKQLEESMRERRQRHGPNKEETEPRRSLRLAKKKVTMGRLDTVDFPEVLPYYMEVVKRGWAGTRKRDPRNKPERAEVSGAISDRDSGDPVEREGSGEVSGKVSGEGSGKVPLVEQ